MKTARSILVPFFTLALAMGSFTAHARSVSIHTSVHSLDTFPVVGTPLPEDSVFTKVKREASFPGGEQGWQAFLGRNLKPNTPLKHKAPPGEYMVIVQFIVDTDGKLVDLKPITAHGYGMEEEVVRVIKKSPRWTPALIDKGRKVKAYRKQPISFVVPAAK